MSLRSDGSYAIATNIRFQIGIDELAAGVAAAGRDKGFLGMIQVVGVTGDAYWDEADLRTARRTARLVGRGGAMTAVRESLDGHGRSAFDDLGDFFNLFPEEVARARAAELWPALDPLAGPFGGHVGDHDGPPGPETVL